MSEGADTITQICENSLTTLKVEDNPEELPPRTISYNTRRPRFGTGNVPLSPYILIDGKKLRSSLAFTKKSSPRRVSFPANDNLLVTGYLEPANPWKLAENVNHEDLISAYKASCIKHNTDPLEIVISQLETLDISKKNSELLNLKGQLLDSDHCEPLEEIFKRIQFNKVDLEATSLDDESSVILFDMLEYYESAKHLNISSNPGIGIQGWHACANLIRKTRCLKHLEAKDVTLNEQDMNILSRALRVVCHLHVLNLENCGLSGRSIVTLVSALKVNTGIKELYLADNGLNFYDAIQLGSLLRFNNHIQLLDISNNNIQDDGVRDILEGLINQINEDKDGKGLNVLILWNNQLTQKSSPSFSRIIALSKTLETLNIGKNTLTDELLFTIKDALKKNRILLQLGIQSTELTCDGIVTLSEIIEINEVLQRIDLRNNDIQMTGMRALSSAMKKNKSITKIDLDDKPKMKVDDLAQTLHQYTQLVAEIQVCCSENEQSRITEENSEGSESSRHSILCSTNSRKISLTCQTLPCSLPTMISIQNNAPGQTMLEPKRINGGRLRSPALSPASSPIASPIPSPSRSRFVVSRVPETSLCSANPSTSSSPVTLPFESPTYLASSASGSSRFRVSVVESASTKPLHKPTVTSSEDDVTFGLNLKINTAEPTDSDDTISVFKSNLETNNAQSTENLHSTLSKVSYLVSNEVEERCALPANESASIKKLSTDIHSSKATTKTQLHDSIKSVPSKSKEFCDVQYNQINIPTRLESVTSRHVQNAESNYNEGIQDIKAAANVNKDEKSSSCIIVNDKSVITNKKHDVTKNVTSTFLNERPEIQPQINQKSCIQRHTPNLEKLLSLFQHPSCFFPISQLKSRSTFQDSLNSLMARGNKFHCYLNESKDRIRDHDTEISSVSQKTKSTKSFNISEMLSLKSLTNMFPSFKFEDDLNVSKQDSKSYSKTVTEVNLLLRKERGNTLTDVQKEYDNYNNDNKQFNFCIKGLEINISTLGNRLLPEEIQSKSYVELINRNLLLSANYIISNIAVDNCLTILNNSLLTRISENKMIVPLSKFLNVHEYSLLKTTINDVKIENIEAVLKKIDSVLVKKTCDKSSTDSINFTSDSNSLFCNIMYDITNINDMYTVNTSDNMHNLVILNLNAKGDVKNNSVFKIENKQSNLAYFICNERDCNINNKSLAYCSALKINIKTNCVNNKVTKMHSIYNNYNYKKAFATVHNMPSNEVERVDICHGNNSVDWQNTIVNCKPAAGLSKKNFMYEDINIDFDDNTTDLCTSVIYKDVTNPSRIQEVLKTFNAKDNKYFEPSNVKETRADDLLMENAMGGRFGRISIMSIPRAYCYVTDFNKSIPRDLIFYMADQADSSYPNSAIKIKTSIHDLPLVSDSRMNSVIKRPQNIHRKSEISKIRGRNFSVNHNVQKSTQFHMKQKLQENDDSETDSECPSKCSKVYTIAHSKRSVSPIKKSYDTRGNPLENIYMFTKFGSNIVQRVKFTNPDAISDMTQKYLNTIKCAVTTTMCSKVAVNTRNNVTVEMISDESTNVAEPSTVIHATSTK
ncbi:uncharacterized protein LOC128891449 isoform X1 [Hylaeus anthracinus]|uniref:uncharacterized protein LOC128891449 isoform X1 n=2 Tax=Hylaeus anthracinus TaxID=313031 RepID=UPI0023B9FBBA|nr:uncharacterized protein LOC128891449 isoform X1 [Hylaeus anthracinus]